MASRVPASTRHHRSPIRVQQIPAGFRVLVIAVCVFAVVVPHLEVFVGEFHDFGVPVGSPTAVRISSVAAMKSSVIFIVAFLLAYLTGSGNPALFGLAGVLVIGEFLVVDELACFVCGVGVTGERGVFSVQELRAVPVAPVAVGHKNNLDMVVSLRV